MIRKSSSYLNSEILQNNSTYSRHFKSSHLGNICNEHSYKKNLTIDSTCSNYSFNKTINYPNLSFFSQEMLYFSWNTNSILSH